MLLARFRLTGRPAFLDDLMGSAHRERSRRHVLRHRRARGDVGEIGRASGRDIGDWSSDVCSSDLSSRLSPSTMIPTALCPPTYPTIPHMVSLDAPRAFSPYGPPSLP